MEIIRIEHKDGGGVYHSKFSPLNPHIYNISNTDPIFYNIMCKHRHLPTPFEDNLDCTKDGRKWYCAFMDLIQLREWLTIEEVRSLIDSGFNVYRLSVSGDLQIGEKQVLYRKNTVTTKKKINHLFL